MSGGCVTLVKKKKKMGAIVFQSECECVMIVIKLVRFIYLFIEQAKIGKIN
jgi:hypothetical protein